MSLLLQAVTYGLFIAVIAGYWYGTWRLRRGRRKVTNGFTRLVSLLLAAYARTQGRQLLDLALRPRHLAPRAR